MCISRTNFSKSINFKEVLGLVVKHIDSEARSPAPKFWLRHSLRLCGLRQVT